MIYKEGKRRRNLNGRRLVGWSRVNHRIVYYIYRERLMGIDRTTSSRNAGQYKVERGKIGRGALIFRGEKTNK